MQLKGLICKMLENKRSITLAHITTWAGDRVIYQVFHFYDVFFNDVSRRNTMEADVLNALKSQTAYLSGVREHPLIVVNVSNGELKASWKKQPLDLCLKYLVNSLR